MISAQEKDCPEKDFKWVKKKVKALGVWFSTNPEEVTSVNFSEKQVKITNSLKLLGKPTTKLNGKNNCFKESDCLSTCLYPIALTNRALYFKRN